MQQLAANKQLSAYQHKGFWQAMDTQRGGKPSRRTLIFGQDTLEVLVMVFSNVYKNRKVLVTRHTGFKGSWLVLWLEMLGAKVTGISLPSETSPNHWNLLGLDVDSFHIDIRDEGLLRQKIMEVQPDVVFHLAAQPLVRRSYCSSIPMRCRTALAGIAVGGDRI